VIPWRVNQPRRLDRRRPQLEDLAVSGAAENDADLVILFHESEYGIDIMIAKNRHGPTGSVYNSRDLGG
jgi:replicative DNA helicase